MRHCRSCALGGLLVAVPLLLSCDSIDSGHLADDPGPPVLLRILIQDELPRGGRNVATDLLDKAPPIACSDREPCPVGEQFSHPPCNLATGVCPDPLNPNQTPPALGVVGTLGGNQIRLVFNKLLDPAMAVTITDPKTNLVAGFQLLDPSIIGLYDANGKELATLKYFDPTGSPTLTSNLFLSPLGPALVLKPKQPFTVLTKYSIRIKPDQMKDAKGQVLTKDGNGDPIASTFEFTTEGFTYAGGNPIDLKDKNRNPDGAIDTKDVLVVKTNTRFDPSSGALQVTVKKNGVPVEIAAAPDFGTEPKLCWSVANSPTRINVFRVRGEDRADWEEGEDYTVSVTAIAQDNRTALFALDPFGKTPYKDIPFKVKQGVDPAKLFIAEDLLLPWECEAPQPTADMGSGPDGGGGGGSDMANPPVDGGTSG